MRMMGDGISPRPASFRMLQQQHQSPSASSASLDRNNESQQIMSKRWKWIIRETQAVSLWSCTCMLVRLAISVLVSAASYDIEALRLLSFGFLPPQATNAILTAVSLLARWVVCLLPKRLATGSCPGFFVSNPAILLWVRDKTCVIPSLPIRCCEYMMGRISLSAMLAIVPVHLLTCYGTGFFVQNVFPDAMARVMFETPQYTDTADATWVVFFSKQVLVNALFSLAILVIPVLFRLNKIPRGSLVVLVYPLYDFSVDKFGMGDLFSPSFLLMGMLNNQPAPPLWRFLGSIFGGLAAGVVMNNYFPDSGSSIKQE